MSYATRADFPTIAGWIAANARVLDRLGCGDGSLLALPARVARCIRLRHRNRRRRRAGVDRQRRQCHPERPGKRPRRFRQPVVRQRDPVADAAGDAAHRGDRARDAAGRARSDRHLPELRPLVAPDCRCCAGRMPVSKNLPYQWYDTPNIHLCTVGRFRRVLRARGFDVLERVVLHDARRVSMLPNLLRLARHLSLPARRAARWLNRWPA